MLPQEAIYADNADFITDDKQKQEDLKSYIKDILLEENLKVNESRTEETTMRKGTRNQSKDYKTRLRRKMEDG